MVCVIATNKQTLPFPAFVEFLLRLAHQLEHDSKHKSHCAVAASKAKIPRIRILSLDNQVEHDGDRRGSGSIHTEESCSDISNVVTDPSAVSPSNGNGNGNNNGKARYKSPRASGRNDSLLHITTTTKDAPRSNPRLADVGRKADHAKEEPLRTHDKNGQEGRMETRTREEGSPAPVKTSAADLGNHVFFRPDHITLYKGTSKLKMDIGLADETPKVSMHIPSS